MPTINVVLRTGETKTVEADVDASLMEALRDNGVDEILAICGGCCACATCHVYIDFAHFDRLPPMSDDESDLLDIPSRQPTSRLSCQVSLANDLTGMTVKIAPES